MTTTHSGDNVSRIGTVQHELVPDAGKNCNAFVSKAEDSVEVH